MKCAWVCRYYAENAERFLADEVVETPASRSFIRYQPMGVVLVIMPWNYPFWQVFRFIAPGLDGGQCGLAETRFECPAVRAEDRRTSAAGRVSPQACFQTLLIGSDKVDRILDDPRIAAATFTGSEGAGIQVGTGAAQENQESGAGARRQRSLYRHAQRKSGGSGHDWHQGSRRQ